ncbi:MAG: hypothetical protein JRF51_10915 [Deltaproteobacteria bacterium]|nr:hypothetical protein [Deltaproteobacteria bacterium]
MTCKQIREAIIEGENEQAVQIAKSLVNAGVNSEEIIIDGVTKAMEYLDEKCTRIRGKSSFWVTTG